MATGTSVKDGLLRQQRKISIKLSKSAYDKILKNSIQMLLVSSFTSCADFI